MRISPTLILVIIFGCQQAETKKEDSGIQADGSKIVRSKYDNGKTKAEVIYRDGKKNGLSRSFDREGNMTLELPYVDSKKDGQSKKYYAGGKQLYQTTQYKADQLQGAQVKYRPNGTLMSEAQYENDLPCSGLKEYLENGAVKKKYPRINIQSIDELESKGTYTLEISMSEKVKSVKYYTGKLSATGCLSDNLDFVLLDEPRRTGIIKYMLPPGAFMMQEVNIIASVETLLGNTYITQQKYNLAIKNN